MKSHVSTKIKLILYQLEMEHLNHASHTPQLLLFTILSGKRCSYDGLSSLITLYEVTSMLIIVLSILECVQVLNSQV